MTAARSEPEGRGGADDPLEDLAVDGRVADDAVVRAGRAGLELGLHERDDRRRRRPARSVLATGPSTSRSEMNETSTTARSTGSGSVVAVRVRAFVRSIDDDPIVAARAIPRAGRARRRPRRPWPRRAAGARP